MPRIFAIDYGLKRTGFACTDPLQIIASPLETVRSHEAIDFLKKFMLTEQIETFVLGMPVGLKGESTDATEPAKQFHKRLLKEFPTIPVYLIDERFSSKMATRALIDGGMKKSDRQIKGNVDKVSAAILLQNYMDRKAMNSL